MAADGTSTKKRSRVPRPGASFAFLRVIGLVLTAIGVLIIIASTVELIVLLIRLGPDLVDVLSYHGESQTAGFYLLLILFSLVLPLFTGLIGIVMGVIGFVFHRLASQPAAEPSA